MTLAYAIPNIITNEAKNIIVFYFTWILLHHVASHVYSYLCTPNTMIGFLYSPFMVVTPHCQAIRWVLYEGSNVITTMWITMGTYFTSKVLLSTRN